jgi:SAM-dependent MidA family methyltransferase
VDGYLPWSVAMERALYGPGGFYVGPDGPAAHFRTSVHASALFAGAVVRLLREVDAALGHPDELAFVDLAAGRGELVAAVHAGLVGDGQDREFGDRLRLVAVELAERPEGLPDEIEWRSELPSAAGGLTGLVVANEYLDNVPCDLVELTANGPRQVLVAADGTERLGPEPDPAARAWLDEWWPLARVGKRAEVGFSRDLAWRTVVERLDRGVAVAIDYAHDRAARPLYGSLTGYAHGRQVKPVPDGSCDITAHVALDACAAAAQPLSSWTRTLSQRDALRRLGVSGRRPDHALSASDPRGYLRALAWAGEAAELTAAGGLGDFGWLIQGVRAPQLATLED